MNYYKSNDYKNQNNHQIDYVETNKILNQINDNIKDSNKNVNIVINEKNNSVVYLFGSIHTSPQSSEDVKKLLDIVKPDTVVIELSNERSRFLTANDSVIIKELTTRPKINWFTSSITDFYLSIYQLFFYYTTLMPLPNNNSSNNNESVYIYGSEFRDAFNYAKSNKCSIILGDRDYKVTWKRIANYLDLKTIFSCTAIGIKSFFELYNKSVKEIKEMYYKEATDSINESWDSPKWREMPVPVKKGLLDERDQYIASCIRDAPGKKVVAVVGKAHVRGISKNINSEMEGFYVRRDLEDHVDPTFLAQYSYPLILPSLFLAPATLGTFAFSKLKKKPLSKSQFFLGIVGLTSLEILTTNHLINNFLNKLDTLKNIK